MELMTNMATPAGSSPGQLVLNLVLNIGLPAAVLLGLSGEDYLGPVAALVLALAFPVCFALYDLGWHRQFNFFSAIGFGSILLTGGIGLLQLDSQWLAVEEAGVPLVIAAAIILSRTTAAPLVVTLLSAAIDFDGVRAALRERGMLVVFERRLKAATYLVAGSFLLSATLNYILARLIVTSESGTAAFNAELGRLTVISYPAIALPSLVVMWLTVIWLVAGIRRWSGLALQKIFR
jgi:hypothetical protein